MNQVLYYHYSLCFFLKSYFLSLFLKLQNEGENNDDKYEHKHSFGGHNNEGDNDLNDDNGKYKRDNEVFFKE
jgi:hypothetical protein